VGRDDNNISQKKQQIKRLVKVRVVRIRGNRNAKFTPNLSFKHTAWSSIQTREEYGCRNHIVLR
jgi:hypothetical protein